MMSFGVVLIEPEIPQNTGNIARTCAVTGTELHLVGPMGFDIDEKQVKRAGLDYWSEVNITYYSDVDEFFSTNGGRSLYYASTKSGNVYSDIDYPDDCLILFGKETRGLPEEMLKSNRDYCIRIPMKENQRSLNLSNSAAIIIYEYYRQKQFEGFRLLGSL